MLRHQDRGAGPSGLKTYLMRCLGDTSLTSSYLPSPYPCFDRPGTFSEVTPTDPGSRFPASLYLFIFIFIFTFIYLCVYVWIYMHHDMCVDIRGQLAEAGSLILPCGFLDFNSDHQVWQKSSFAHCDVLFPPPALSS